MDSRTAAMQRFPPNTIGYIIRDSSSACRFGTFKMFLNYIRKIENTGYFKMTYAMGMGSPTIIRKEGKRTDYYDSFVHVYLTKGSMMLDTITFYTVHKYSDGKGTDVKPNSKNSKFYTDMKKRYKMYRRM